MAAGSFPIVVGAGGNGATGFSEGDKAVNGDNSSFNSLISLGGGYGGCNQGANPGTGEGGDGGSGGGAATNGAVGQGTSGQGNNGRKRI